MKSLWNSVLISLNLIILLPEASIVRAEPTRSVPETTSAIATQTKSNSSQPDQNTDNAQKLKLRLEELSRQRKLIVADRLYLGGQFAAAEKLYREVKTPFAQTSTQTRLEPFSDPTQLSPGGKVYWREAGAASGEKIQTRALIPLRLLVERHPEFIPAHLQLAQALQAYDYSKEALEVLERATILYPEQPDLVKAKVATLTSQEKWIEASLAARQFALLNYNQPETPEFIKLADENLERYKKHLRRKLRGNAIANIITGALGYALTGNLFGPFSAIQTTTMLLRGESDVGESIAKQARKQLELVEDQAVVDYVNEIGRKLAQVAGRNDFTYEFYVVLDQQLNAFALPGGKIFVNAGAIAKSNSEAELTGLLAHELSHAILSHGFQLVAEGNLVANVTQFVPLGGTIADLFTLDYSRDMERQADILGTRLLASTGYAADGLRNLLVTLEQQEPDSPFSWLASHPGTDDRIDDLENLIQRSNYNRYAYEGVERHTQIKAQVKKLLLEQEQREQK